VPRVFFSTGEPSGEMLAVTLAEAMREFGAIEAYGIGSERMRAAGFRVTAETAGWASMGPVEALGRILPLYATMWRHAIPILARPPELIVMVDFGAFNLRFAKTLRLLGYRGRILCYFPPGAWLDRPRQARAVRRYATPLTAFTHQRDFYESLGLEIAWFGHPLAALVPPRAARPAPPEGRGTVALLPGSRRGEIERHLPPLLAACALVRRTRPFAQFVCSAANADAERLVREILARPGSFRDVRVVRGSREALDVADAALVASGTAVLEAALREVPLAAFYIVSPAQEKIARRVWTKPYFTLPNLLLERLAIPELAQREANPAAFAARALELLAHPGRQTADLRAARACLGPPDALRRAAAFASVLAGRRPAS